MKVELITPEPPAPNVMIQLSAREASTLAEILHRFARAHRNSSMSGTADRANFAADLNRKLLEAE